jgi:hypothetical protein
MQKPVVAKYFIVIVQVVLGYVLLRAVLHILKLHIFSQISRRFKLVFEILLRLVHRPHLAQSFKPLMRSFDGLLLILLIMVMGKSSTLLFFLRLLRCRSLVLK